MNKVGAYYFNKVRAYYFNKVGACYFDKVNSLDEGAYIAFYQILIYSYKYVEFKGYIKLSMAQHGEGNNVP